MRSWVRNTGRWQAIRDTAGSWTRSTVPNRLSREFPLFGTLVAVESSGQAVLGVIELPALDERIFAARGRGAWCQVGDGAVRCAQVSDCAALADGLYLTSELATFLERGTLAVHQQLEAAAWYARTWGDCYGYYLVATGRAVAMVDAALTHLGRGRFAADPGRSRGHLHRLAGSGVDRSGTGRGDQRQGLRGGAGDAWRSHAAERRQLDAVARGRDRAGTRRGGDADAGGPPLRLRPLRQSVYWRFALKARFW